MMITPKEIRLDTSPPDRAISAKWLLFHDYCDAIRETDVKHPTNENIRYRVDRPGCLRWMYLPQVERCGEGARHGFGAWRILCQRLARSRA